MSGLFLIVGGHAQMPSAGVKSSWSAGHREPAHACPSEGLNKALMSKWLVLHTSKRGMMASVRQLVASPYLLALSWQEKRGPPIGHWECGKKGFHASDLSTDIFTNSLGILTMTTHIPTLLSRNFIIQRNPHWMTHSHTPNILVPCNIHYFTTVPGFPKA